MSRPSSITRLSDKSNTSDCAKYQSGPFLDGLLGTCCPTAFECLCPGDGDGLVTWYPFEYARQTTVVGIVPTYLYDAGVREHTHGSHSMPCQTSESTTRANKTTVCGAGRRLAGLGSCQDIRCQRSTSLLGGLRSRGPALEKQ